MVRWKRSRLGDGSGSHADRDAGWDGTGTRKRTGCSTYLDMGRLNFFVFLSSFILGTLSLIFGSRALIEYYDLFPPDPYSDDPLTWRNVIHNAWGVRRKSLLEQQLENDSEFLKKYTVTMADMKLPIAIAIALSCTVVVAFFALNKKG